MPLFSVLWTLNWINACSENERDGTTITQCTRLMMCTRNLNEEISRVINRETSARTGQTSSKTRMLMEESFTTEIVSLEPSLWDWWENTHLQHTQQLGQRYQLAAGSKSTASLTGNTEFLTDATDGERKNIEKGSDDIWCASACKGNDE